MFLRCPNCRGIIDVHDDNIDFLARCGRCATLLHLRAAPSDRGITARPLPRPGTVAAPSPYTPTGLFAQPTLANLPPVPAPGRLTECPSAESSVEPDPIAELAALHGATESSRAPEHRPNTTAGRLLALAGATALAGTFVLSSLAFYLRPGPQRAQAAPPIPVTPAARFAPIERNPAPPEPARSPGELFPEVRAH